MKNIFLTLLIQTFANVGFSQWKSDVRLTNDAADSYVSYGPVRSIAASGNIVHIVWFDKRDGNTEIYYKRSADGGSTWGADKLLTNSGAETEFPTISISDSAVHVFWGDTRDGGDLEIYYKRSTDGGLNWGADTRLTNDNFYSSYPASAVAGKLVHVAWEDYRDGNLEIYYKRSTDGGLTWKADKRISNNSFESENPSLAVSDSTVHIVWNDDRNGANEVYYSRSTDWGATWSAETRLTNDPAHGNLASLAVSGKNVHLSWYDERDGNREIYYKHSTDAGINWSSDMRMTTDTFASNNPSISLVGSVVHLVWHDERDGNKEIYYKGSADGGSTWSSDIRLTNASDVSGRPSTAASGQVVHMVWYDSRDGNNEIYYKQNPTGNVLSLAELQTSALPFSVYPNPTRSKVNIVFSTTIQQGTIEIISLLGKTIFSENFVSTTQKEIQLTALSPGIYFIRVHDGKQYLSKKIVIEGR